MARTAAGSTTGGGAGPGWARVAKGEGAKGGKRNKRWFFCGVLGQPPQAGGGGAERRQWRKKRGGSPVSKGVEGSRFSGNAQRPLRTVQGRRRAPASLIRARQKNRERRRLNTQRKQAHHATPGNRNGNVAGGAGNGSGKKSRPAGRQWSWGGQPSRAMEMRT